MFFRFAKWLKKTNSTTMQKQIHEFKKTGQIPVDEIVKGGGSVLSFLISLFKEKRSKDDRITHLEQINVLQQQEIDQMKAEIEELKGLVSELLNR